MSTKDDEESSKRLIKTLVAMQEVKTKGKEAKENEYSMTTSDGRKINYFLTKEKRNWLIIILIILGLLFFWCQVRPSYIKHNCSWVQKNEDATPERPAMTKDELVSNGIIRSCETEIANLKKILPALNYQLGDMSVHRRSMSEIDGKFRSMSSDPLYQATSCIEDGNKIINDYKNTIPAKPAKTWYEKSTDLEYKFCLRDKGL